MVTDDDAGGTLTVAGYLREWLEVQRHRLQPTTLKSYRGNVERYLIPHIGQVALAQLTVARLERLFAELKARGGQDGRPLSIRTVKYAAATLGSALSDAVRTGVLDRNVARLARLPTIDPTADEDDETVQVWTAAQARSFLEKIRGHRLEDLWVLALATGMRRGELLGLRWGDVDLDRATIHVRRSLQVVDGHSRLKFTKTSRSRSLGIDERVSVMLDRRRKTQAAQREATGEAWSDSWGLVFTEDDGSHLVPMNVSVAFRWLIRKLDVPTIRLHDLRHVHATLLLQAGTPVKVVSQRLGHASVRVTLDIYTHVLPAMDDDAVARLSDHLYGDEDDA